MFLVGFSRVDITPTESVPLAGYGNTSHRMSKKVLDPLYSSCTALTDDAGTTVLLFHNDIIGSPVHISDPIRKSVSEATGVPFDHIIVGSTHTHSGPDIWNTSVPSIPRYNASLPGKLTQCALEAMADRKPAEGFCCKTNTHRLNFVRHYVLKDGHYMGSNFGSQYKSPVSHHTTQADPEMRLVKFVRKGGKDVILVNWQAHPTRTGGSDRYNITPDFVATFRKEMEDALDCYFTYFTGGAGNISPLSRVEEEHVVHSYREHGRALKDHALEAKYEPMNLGRIRVLVKHHDELLNRPSQERLEAARPVAEYWAKTNDWPGSVAMAVERGFSSQFDATNIVRRHEAEDDLVHIPMTAISFGDFGFATVPYEMFDTNAKEVRDGSPFKITFVSSTTNASVMYIPSAYGFIHGCYEAACSTCKPGAGERLAGILVRMLKSIKE